MKQFVLFLLSFWVFHTTQAQRLIGIITLMNSGKQPISGVLISAEGAYSTYSQNNGKFELNFVNKREGEKVFLNVTKVGYEVVNREYLYSQLRADAENNTISIYMCRKGEVDRQRMRYYGIMEKNITEHYKIKLIKLRQEKNDSLEIFAQLDKERENAIESAKEIAERLSMTNLDDCSQQYKDALLAIEKGEDDIAEAITLLKESDNDLLKAEKELQYLNLNIKSELERAKKNLKQAIQASLLMTDLYILQYNFHAAEKYFEKVLKVDSTDIDILDRYSFYLTNQSRVKKAIYYSKKALEIREKAKENTIVDNIGRIKNINQLGILYASINESELAKKYFLVAKDDIFLIIKQDKERKILIDTAESQKLLIINATVLNNLGVLYYELEEYSESINYYQDALSILLELYQHDSLNVTYKSNVANTYSGLGSVFLDYVSDEGDAFKNSSKYLKTSFGMYKELIETHYSDDYAYMNAVNLNNLGLLHEKAGKFNKSDSLYKESMIMLKTLSNKNPFKYNIEVVRTYVTIALLNYHQFEKYPENLTLKAKSKEYFLMADDILQHYSYDEELMALLKSTIENYLKDLEEAHK